MTDFTSLEEITTLFSVGPDTLNDGSPLASYLAHYRLDKLCQEGISLQVGNITTERFRLWAQIWTPPAPRGTAIIVHGYYDHLGLYCHLLKLLLDEGLQVVLWDLPGHGLSSGERANIDDFDDYIDCLKEVQQYLDDEGLAKGPWIGLGQSTGAAILSTDALTRGDDGHWSALVLLAPLVRPMGWTRAAWVHSLVGPFIGSVPRRFRANTNDADFATFLREHDPLQPVRLPTSWVSAMRRWMPRLMELPPNHIPTLILQGDQDLTVDGDWNLRVLEKKFLNARVHRHNNARHHLVNEAAPIRDELFEHVRDFLNERLPPSNRNANNQCSRAQDTH